LLQDVFTLMEQVEYCLSRKKWYFSKNFSDANGNEIYFEDVRKQVLQDMWKDSFLEDKFYLKFTVSGNGSYVLSIILTLRLEEEEFKFAFLYTLEKTELNEYLGEQTDKIENFRCYTGCSVYCEEEKYYLTKEVVGEEAFPVPKWLEAKP